MESNNWIVTIAWLLPLSKVQSGVQRPILFRNWAVPSMIPVRPLATRLAMKAMRTSNPTANLSFCWICGNIYRSKSSWRFLPASCLDMSLFRSITRELPGKVPFDVNVALINAFQSTWERSTNTCFDQVQKTLFQILLGCVNDIAHPYDVLHSLLKWVRTIANPVSALTFMTREVVSEIVKHHREICFQHLSAVLETQQTPFTQNTHYLQTCQDKWLAMYRDTRSNAGVRPVRSARFATVPLTFTPPKGDHAQIFYAVIILNNVIVQISRAAGLRKSSWIRLWRINCQHIIFCRGALKRIIILRIHKLRVFTNSQFLTPLNGPKVAVLSLNLWKKHRYFEKMMTTLFWRCWRSEDSLV